MSILLTPPPNGRSMPLKHRICKTSEHWREDVQQKPSRWLLGISTHAHRFFTTTRTWGSDKIALKMFLLKCIEYRCFFNRLFFSETRPHNTENSKHTSICAATVPIPIFMFLWAICIFPRSVCLFCCRKISGPIVGIYRSLTDTCMWKLGLRPRNAYSGKLLNSNIFAVKPFWGQGPNNTVSVHYQQKKPRYSHIRRYLWTK